MKFLLPALTVLLTSTSALAAGHDWSGAYLGGQMGYASGTSRYSSDIDEQLKFSPDGFLGGIYGGYNHQFSNNMVLGLDADFSLANIKNNGKYYDGGIRDPEVGTSIKMRWNGAARIRAGYAVDRFLPYVAAGLSYGKYKLSVWDEEGSMLDVSKTRTGWTIGAGLDYAVTDNLIARVEYRYSDFGKAKIFSDVSDSSASRRTTCAWVSPTSSEARRLHQTTGSSGAGRGYCSGLCPRSFQGFPACSGPCLRPARSPARLRTTDPRPNSPAPAPSAVSSPAPAARWPPVHRPAPSATAGRLRAARPSALPPTTAGYAAGSA